MTESDALRIVAAKDEHSQGLIELISPIFAEYEGVYFVLDEMPELLNIASAFGALGGAAWCALRGDRVVGSVGWVPTTVDGASGAELRKLYVAQSERRTGLGGQLLGQVEAAATAAGCTFIELWSDVKFITAHHFYERRGFVRGSETRELGDVSETREFYFRKPL